MTLSARVRPGRLHSDRRRKATQFSTTDQRLLEEIRDLLLVLANRDETAQLARIANATRSLANEVETLRRVLDQDKERGS
jgi:hypothetical protein